MVPLPHTVSGRVYAAVLLVLFLAPFIFEWADQPFYLDLLSNSGLDGVYGLSTELEMREAGDGDHPLVIGHEGVARFTTALRHCVAAQLASFAPEMVPAD